MVTSTHEIVTKKINAMNAAWEKGSFEPSEQFKDAPNFFEFNAARFTENFVEVRLTAHWLSFECEIALLLMSVEGVFADHEAEEGETFTCDMNVSAGGDCIPGSVAARCAFECAAWAEKHLPGFGFKMLSF